MTQYNTFNIKLFNSKLTKLKSEIKNGAKVNLNQLLNVIGNSDDD